MKARNIAVAALLALGASAVTIASTDADALRENINVAENSDLNVTVQNGVAHIFGSAKASEIARAKRVAQKSSGIDSVIITATAIN